MIELREYLKDPVCFESAQTFAQSFHISQSEIENRKAVEKFLFFSLQNINIKNKQKLNLRAKKTTTLYGNVLMRRFCFVQFSVLFNH